MTVKEIRQRLEAAISESFARASDETEAAAVGAGTYKGNNVVQVNIPKSNFYYAHWFSGSSPNPQCGNVFSYTQNPNTVASGSPNCPNGLVWKTITVASR